MIVYTSEWPEPCQRFYARVCHQLAMSGRLEMGARQWIAEELRAADFAGRQPSAEAAAALEHRGEVRRIA